MKDESDGSTRPETLPTTEAVPSRPCPDPVDIPRQIGGYRIVRKLGEGGMRIVYEAEQTSPSRRVALKVIREGAFIDEVQVRMFRREADALARLKHPNIGAIYEAGQTETGQHFFAMELVVGRTLAAEIPSEPPSALELRRRLVLFRTICEAVHYAHQKGVIHRDLKPSNIILTNDSTIDREPLVKILDFGLARITDADVRTATLVTEVGAIKGTLPYMSPEQTRGAPEAIDTRADVYALGVILYEMASGRRPYDLDRRSLVEALRIICEETPRPLRSRESRWRNADVETIAMKALEKDPDRRYSSAAALGADVGRYLSSQPILARPPSAAYQVRKFAARHRALVAGLLATMLVLMAGVVVSSTFGIREARQRRAAEASAYFAGVTAAEAGLRLFEIADVKRRLVACPPGQRGWEWRHLSFRSEMSERIITGHTSRVYPVVVSPDGTLIVSGSADPENAIRFWDAKTGRSLKVLQSGETTEKSTAGVRSLSFSPDGKALASGSDDGVVRVWDVESGRKLLELRGHEGRVNAVAYIPDGSEVVSASFDRSVRRWDPSTGRALGVLGRHEDAIWGLAVCGDGARIVTGSIDKKIKVWERLTGRALVTIDAPDAVIAVACSPAGDRLAAALTDGTMRIWDARTGDAIGSPARHEDMPTGVAFSPDGRTIATSSKDRTVRLWDAASGEAIVTLVGHDNVVMSVAFDPSGRSLLSGSWDRTVRVWSADPGRTSPVLASFAGQMAGLAVTRDGSRVLTGSPERGISVWDIRTRAEISRIPNAGEPLEGFDLSPDGAIVVAFQKDLRLRVFDLRPDGTTSFLRERLFDGVRATAFVPGTHVMLVVCAKEGAGGTLHRWNVETDELGGEVATSLQVIRTLAVSPDASRVAIAGYRPVEGSPLWLRGPFLQILDLRSNRILAEREITHVDPTAKIGNPVGALLFHPDGTRLVSTHMQDFTVRIWDGTTLAPLATTQGHTEMVPAAAFSPDGTRLATAGHDHAVRLWDGVSGEPRLALRTANLSVVTRVAFTPDGETIISGETVGFGRAVQSTIRMWRTRP